MASELLYQALAQALSQPSRAYREAQAGFGAIDQGISGYKAGAELADSIRKRRLQEQTLGQVLGASAPTDTANIPIDQAEMLVRPVEAYSRLKSVMNNDQSYRPWRIVPGMTTKDNKPVQQNIATGEVRPVDLLVTPTGRGAGFQTSEWNTASDSDKALAKSVYEGLIRPQDLSWRDKGTAVKLANEYARLNNLPPLRSYAGEVAGSTAKAFATGKQGFNVTSLNTALGHANDALDAYQNVANTDTRFLNVPLNKLRQQTNDPNIVQLQTTLNALSGELATVFKGTGGTDQEISHWQNVLSHDLTPAQARGVITTVDSLLRSRLNALDYQRKAGMSGRSESPLLSPKAEAISKRLGSNSSEFQGANVPSFNTPEEAESSNYKGPALINGKRAVIH